MSNSGGAITGRSALVPWRLVLLVAGAYTAGSLMAFLLFQASDTGAALFAAAGVTFSALVLSERRRWPWIIGTVVVVEVAVDLTLGGVDPSHVWGFALANTIEPLIGAGLLRRFLPGAIDVGRRRDLGLFLGCAVLAGPFVGGLIGASTLALGMGENWLQAFLPFWAGDALGVLTVGGTVLAWNAGHFPADRRARLEQGAWVLVTIVVAALVFWPTQVPLSYLCIPLLFWLAFRYGVGMVTAAGLALALTANVLTVTGHGPWAVLAGSPRLETSALQLYVAVAVLSAWLIAVEIAEREAARMISREEAAARRRVEALQEVTAGLATAVTSEAIAGVLVRHGIALLADHGVVALAGDDGRSVRVWTAGIGENRPRPETTVPLSAPALITTAMRTGAPVRAQTPAQLAERFPQGLATSLLPGTHSALAVPARIGSTPVGALAFGFGADRAVDADVAAVAQTLAELMAQALHRARLYEDEHEAAHQLQQAFLPVVPDRLPGVSIAGCYRPADQQHDVGGDWYDAFPLPEGGIGFVVGDVVGHDLRAAAAMGRLHSALRVLAAGPHRGPAAVLEALDRACPSIPGASLTTLGYGEYDPVTGRLRYACAGHPPPLLVADGAATFLDGGRSLPLGVTTGPRPEAQVAVPPGAMLVWYSDGLVERRDASIDEGLDRLAEVVTEVDSPDPQQWCDVLLRELTSGHRLRDDVVLLCLRLEGVTGPDGAVPAPATASEDGRVGA